MKLKLFRGIMLPLFMLVIYTSFAQDSIRTDVFVLNTCAPNNYSLIKALGKNYSKKEFVTKLQVKSNRPSAFQISGINPLRYRYFINNEAVTQFMESSPFTLSINNFTNGEYLGAAPEIRVPEIFKTDSISSKVREKINAYKNEIKAYKDSIEKTNSRRDDIWAAQINSITDTGSRRRAYLINPAYNAQFRLLQTYQMLWQKSLKEYQMYSGGLPLSNPKFALLEQYRQIDTTEHTSKDIDSIKKFQRKFSYEYLMHDYRFKEIDSLLNKLEMDFERIRYLPFHDTLIRKLRYYSFSWLEERDSYFDSRLSNSVLTDNINDVRQQILDKRFQLYEEFVLNIATRIGVLVQNQFREYSSFNNALENFNCISPKILDSIVDKKNKLSSTFEFIQQTSAELQILVSYLDINTELYQSIAKKINNNYVFLLAYLKNLEFITKENIVQYTLPTHTNLKNIDLIRYTIKREDKVTKNSQTYNYDFWLKGGLKIDFSVGFFGTRLVDNKYNKVLLDTVGGVDKIQITRQDDGHTGFAFGGMVNVTPRNGASWINIGGSIGIAYSNSQNLQVLASISLHFGKSERIILHGGAAFGVAKYLDISASDFKFYDKNLNVIPREKIDDLKEKDRVYILQATDIKYSSYTIPTVDKFNVKPFIGISYNLSKKNALQAVSGAGVSTFSTNYNNGISY